MNKTTNKTYNKIKRFLKKNGAKKVAVFGSYVHGTATSDSDIDVLVEFVNSKSLLELVRLERELGELLNRKVDLLTEKSISPYLLNTIKEEMQVIYE